MKRELYLIEAANVVAWANQLTKEKLNKIDFKVRWALKKAVAKLVPDVQEYEKFRDEEFGKIKEVYFDDEHSIEYTEPKLDDDGNEVKDAEGNVETQQMKKVKDEYMAEYQAKIDELNGKINEILVEKNTYEYNSADIDAFVEGLDDLAPLEFADIEMLDALLSERVNER